jgi:transposase
MGTKHFIALDTHCGFCQMAAINAAGKVIRRERMETTIPKLVEAIESIRKPRVLTFEEGPLAGWLSRSLAEHVDELIVCEPRRNALIAKEGDKDDPIDAEKLALLFRGGFLKQVHQAETLDRAILKQHVGFYHDRIRERVRQGHQFTCQLRRHGVFYGIDELKNHEARSRAWRELPNRQVLRQDLNLLWTVYELLLEQEEQIRSELVRLARKERVVRRLEELPGIGWIRALTFYVYIDTPDRFERKTQLWRYCGLGLDRSRSGNGPTRVRLAKAGNHRLKSVLLGGALSAILQGANPFADKYAYWTKEKGLHPSTARRNVARCIATTMWSLWKTDRSYDPRRAIVADRSPLMR